MHPPRMNMNALQLQAIGRLEQIDCSIPAPSRGELLICTAAATICTSDLGDIRENPFGLPLPRVLGHEAAGIVARVGEGVNGWSEGDRAACHPVISCHACEECRRGHEHLCTQMSHLGHDRDGTYAEYFTIPAERARHLPDSVDFAHGALLEPVSVCLEAVRQARVAAGDTVLVAGDGPFGVMIARLAKRAGARTIVAGMQPFRLQRTQADVIIRIDEHADPQKALLDATDGRGVESAILAVDAQAALDLCIATLRPRGRLAVFAIMPGRPSVDMLTLLVKELELVGACNDEDLIDEALDVIVNNTIGLDEIITHRVPFAEWRRAFDLAEHHPEEALKVALVLDGSAQT